MSWSNETDAAPGPVGVVGLGVVGGTIAAAFREAGVHTLGYDPYLAVGSPAGLGPCRVVFLCVPTPSVEGDGYDLSAVWTAVHQVEPHLVRGTLVAVKSTIPPGTCAGLQQAFPRLLFASVPEFLVATRPKETFTRPDRVVIGAPTPEAAAILAGLMALVAPAAPQVVVRPDEAEMVKLCSNAMLSAKVAMANELHEICSLYGVAWTRIQAAVGLDRRIGPDHLTVTPERGFGGECLPKDLNGLIAAGRETGYEPDVLAAIAAFNRRVRREAARRSEPLPERAAGAPPVH